MHGKALLRLHPEVLKQWPESEPLNRIRALQKRAGRLDDDPDTLAEDLRSAWPIGPPAWKAPLDWLKSVATNLSRDKKLAKSITVNATAA